MNPLLLRECFRALEGEGYLVESGVVVKGASGVYHAFDAIVYGRGDRILVDHARNEKELLKALGKVVDALGEKILLLVDERLMSILGDSFDSSRSYVKVVKAGDVGELLDSVRDLLG